MKTETLQLAVSGGRDGGPSSDSGGCVWSLVAALRDPHPELLFGGIGDNPRVAG